MRKALVGVSVVTLGLVVAAGGAYWWLNEPRPQGMEGVAADALAERMVASLGGEGWERTGAIEWSFAGDRVLWDRERHWARVSFGDVTAVVGLDAQQGVAWRDGQLVGDDEQVGLVRAAYERWANHSFWLCAPFKAFDGGTSRKRVPRDDGGFDLLVEYASGGVTPGDAYLWLLDPSGRPEGWKMWVSILPIGGVYASWEEWVTLPTGAEIATRHAFGPVSMTIGDLRGAERLAGLEDPDPFQALVERGVPTR